MKLTSWISSDVIWASSGFCMIVSVMVVSALRDDAEQSLSFERSAVVWTTKIGALWLPLGRNDPRWLVRLATNQCQRFSSSISPSKRRRHLSTHVIDRTWGFNLGKVLAWAALLSEKMWYSTRLRHGVTTSNRWFSSDDSARLMIKVHVWWVFELHHDFKNPKIARSGFEDWKYP